MNHERYACLQRSGGALTAEERAEGWHYCLDWDGLLIRPGDPEHEVCTCQPVSTLSLDPSKGAS